MEIHIKITVKSKQTEKKPKKEPVDAYLMLHTGSSISIDLNSKYYAAFSRFFPSKRENITRTIMRISTTTIALIPANMPKASERAPVRIGITMAPMPPSTRRTPMAMG